MNRSRIPQDRKRGAKRPPKRERTRNKLLIAAQELLLEQKAGEVTVSDIANHADVVHTTVYNYYSTQQELFEAVMMLVLTAYMDTIKAVTAGIEDPARIVSTSSRQMMRVPISPREVGHLIFNAGLPSGALSAGIQVDFQRDLQRGLKAGRFTVNNPEFTISMVVGAGFGAARDLQRGVLSPDSAELFAEHVLILCGLTRKEAAQIANEPIDFRKLSFPISWLDYYQRTS